MTTHCDACCGTGIEDLCKLCNEVVDNCDCDESDFEDIDSSTYEEECAECDGTGEVEETEEEK